MGYGKMEEKKVKIITYDCPGCGASLKIDAEQTTATCEYCGTHFAIESEKASSQNTEYSSNSQDTRRTLATKLGIIIPVAVIAVFLLFSVVMPMLFGGLFSVVGLLNMSMTEEQVIEVDPFENINVQIEGMEPWAKIKDVTNNSDIYGIKYNIDKQTRLSNGDVLTIEVEEMKGYKWTRNSYEYKVSGLDSIVLDVEQLSDADKEMLLDEARKEIENNWKSNLMNSGLTMDDINLCIMPYKIYINSNKEEDDNYFSSNNIVYPAFEITFEGNGNTYTVYQFAAIENVYLSSDGAMHGDFNNMSAVSGYIYSCNLGFEESFAIWGFDSIVKMESDMEDENYNLIK